MFSTALIEAYGDWQTALRDHGCTAHAEGIFFELCSLIEADPFLDVQGFEAVLERLHDLAYPVASTRPPRLYAHELADARE